MNDKIKVIVMLTVLMTITVFQITQAMIVETPSIEVVNAQEPVVEEEVMVSEDAVRIRIIPHSNAYQDQLAKRMVTFAIDEFLMVHESSLNSVDATRQFIQQNIGQIENRVDEVFTKINYDLDFSVTYGAHLFPEKHFNGEVFPAGYYESLVIRIGEGRGNNWWCFINPGMCLGPNISEISEETTSEHWNVQNQVVESTQEVLRNQEFLSFISGAVENLFTSESDSTWTDTNSQVANQSVDNNEIDWFLFEDER